MFEIEIEENNFLKKNFLFVDYPKLRDGYFSIRIKHVSCYFFLSNVIFNVVSFADVPNFVPKKFYIIGFNL